MADVLVEQETTPTTPEGRFFDPRIVQVSAFAVGIARELPEIREQGQVARAKLDLLDLSGLEASKKAFIRGEPGGELFASISELDEAVHLVYDDERLVVKEGLMLAGELARLLAPEPSMVNLGSRSYWTREIRSGRLLVTTDEAADSIIGFTENQPTDGDPFDFCATVDDHRLFILGLAGLSVVAGANL